MRAGGQRRQRRQIDLDDVGVPRAAVGFERTVRVLSPLRFQESLGHVVGGENRGRGAELGAHVRDGRALGHRQRFDAFAAVLDDLAHAAFDRQPAQHFQNHVLGRDVGSQPAGEFDFDDLGHGQVQRAAAHGHGHVQTARADGEHAQPAARRRVGIGSQQRHAGYAEPFEVHLMADAVARLGHRNAVL